MSPKTPLPYPRPSRSSRTRRDTPPRRLPSLLPSRTLHPSPTAGPKSRRASSNPSGETRRHRGAGSARRGRAAPPPGGRPARGRRRWGLPWSRRAPSAGARSVAAGGPDDRVPGTGPIPAATARAAAAGQQRRSGRPASRRAGAPVRAPPGPSRGPGPRARGAEPRSSPVNAAPAPCGTWDPNALLPRPSRVMDKTSERSVRGRGIRPEISP